MKIQPSYLYYNNINFKNRIRPHCVNYPKPMFDGNNPNISVYVYEDLNSGIDIAERTFDSFTGLRDKNYLLAVLKNKIEESQKTGKSLSFAMFDMDNFKSVNELLGYEVGDDFIRFTANGVDSVAKENALATYRFGGEEFIVIFEGQDEDTQKEIVNKVVSAINSNKYIKSQEKTYVENAQDRVVSYSTQISKIKTLMDLKSRQEIYGDLRKNMKTEEAKNDPYLIDSIDAINAEIRTGYLALIQSCLPSERDSVLRKSIETLMMKIKNNETTSKGEMELLDEYLKFKYDKSAELFQVKKWLKDFKDNNGFSITGSAVTFNPAFLKNKTPMQLIGIAGESLKRGKASAKGRGYFN